MWSFHCKITFKLRLFEIFFFYIVLPNGLSMFRFVFLRRYTHWHLFTFKVVRKILGINKYIILFYHSSSASCTWKLKRPSRPGDVSFTQPWTIIISAMRPKDHKLSITYSEYYSNCIKMILVEVPFSGPNPLRSGCSD